MRTVLYVGAGLAAIAGALLLGTATSWYGLVTERPMAKYAKETERQVYVNSVAHLQGANSGIGIDCANMENASNPPTQRHAFAAMVLMDASSYSGDADLSPDAKSCVREAHDLLSQALPQ